MTDSPDEVSPRWLTAVLRDSGALSRGQVATVDVAPTDAFNSRTVRLRLTYSPDAAGDAPAGMILKRNAPAAWAVRAGQVEVAFYDLVARSPGHPAGIVPCLASGVDERTGDSFLLLADLSESHQIVLPREASMTLRGVPPDAHIMAVVDTLARLHAYWWGRVTAPVEVAAWARDETEYSAFRAHREAAWQLVASDNRSWLPVEIRGLYQRILAGLDAYWECQLRDRMRARRQLTLVHGDAYFGNFLCPPEPKRGITYLIDWQDPSFDLGAADLVNMCATFWTPAQRWEQQREQRVLRRYHDQLLAGGVTGYSLADLHADYARALVGWVLVPVQDAAGGAARDYWWPKMNCLVAAFRDWNCDELLHPPAAS